jgi:NAD(P)-dependent dehydrogenase (short-subunit alcohol dehydrogenase family)
MKTIVITGSTRGIGYGLATEFLKAGHQVVINGRDAEKVAVRPLTFPVFTSQISGFT